MEYTASASWEATESGKTGFITRTVSFNDEDRVRRYLQSQVFGEAAGNKRWLWKNEDVTITDLEIDEAQ